MSIEFIKGFREKYSIPEINNYLDSIKDLSVLIIGETIIDEYVYGNILGKAGKFPIVAFENITTERYEGGVLAVKNHLQNFVSKVGIMTDSNAIVKRRYTQDNQKLFETYYKEYGYQSLHNNIEDYDIVLICDFGHGFFTRDKRKEIKNKGKFIALNTQVNAGNEGLNTIQKYNYDADYICIDSHELRLAFSNIEDPIEDILKNNFKTQHIVSITTGKDGCIVYKNKQTCNIPAFAKKVVDKVGAGDAFFSITAPLAYKDTPMDLLGFIGNCVGGIVVGYPGNKEFVDRKRLDNFIEDIYNER